MSISETQERVQIALVEARLDSIERMLMNSGVGRSERAAIVQSVEDQIFEMIEERGGDVSRERILTILRELDPPEAYCDEVRIAEPAARSRRSSQAARSTEGHFYGRPEVRFVERKHSAFAIAAFVLAVISIPTAIVIPLGTGLALLGAIFGGVAMVLIGQSRGKVAGAWMAITAFSLFGLHLTAGLTLLLLGNY